MKTTKILLIVLFIVSVSNSFGQEKKSSFSNNDNPVRSKVAAISAFKLPYSVEIFSDSERDQKNRAVVNGLTVKGAIISVAVSSVGNMAGGGAAVASYAATGKSMSNANVKVTISQAETGDEATTMTDDKGNFSLTLAHDTLHTIYVNGVEYGQIKMKTKHDTVKNSINNVR